MGNPNQKKRKEEPNNIGTSPLEKNTLLSWIKKDFFYITLLLFALLMILITALYSATYIDDICEAREYNKFVYEQNEYSKGSDFIDVDLEDFTNIGDSIIPHER